MDMENVEGDIMMFDVILSVIALAFATFVLINLLRHEKKMNKRVEELDKGWERIQNSFLKDPETTVRKAKKEDFKPNAWHKPPND